MNNAPAKSNPVTASAVRSVLDVISFGDVCGGWRSVDAVIESLTAKLGFPVEAHQLISYLQTANENDRLFETQLIDGEPCIRSHKFDRNRETFIQAVSDLRRQVQANPAKQAEILQRSSFLLVKALLPKHTSMTRPSRLVSC